MNLYEIVAIHDGESERKRYRNIVGKNETQAIVKAQNRHRKAGYTMTGFRFQVVDCKVILCVSAFPEEV